jgi:hypothetical protein
MFKIVVIVLLLLILASLGSGLFFLINDRGKNRRTVKALTFRIGLSVALVSAPHAGLCGWPDQAARTV